MIAGIQPNKRLCPQKNQTNPTTISCSAQSKSNAGGKTKPKTARVNRKGKHCRAQVHHKERKHTEKDPKHCSGQMSCH